MGYYSSVRINMQEQAWDPFKSYVKEYLVEHGHKSDLNDYNLLTNADLYGIDLNAHVIHIGWDWIKWYEYDFDDVDAIMQALKRIYNDGFAYTYARIGENAFEGDFVQESYPDKDGKEIEVPSIQVKFEDPELANLDTHREEL